ncbi:hypothetical protein FHL15_008287 [Xylaria flabelliformis]|uniref:Uncharacterized protein n=1 Tax=Xylaria flabelliformis TaxID=2512241 RepID=A0A553HSG2_9PEZI|nr:hypothetical protein FHL15_008287 [Xylaria flabelliformis]
MGLDFDFNGPLSPTCWSRDVDNEFNALMPPYGSGVGNSSIEPFIIDVSDSDEDDVPDLPPPVYGDGVGGETESNDAISPMSLDIAGFERDISYTESAEMTYASRDIPLDEQVKFDRVALLVADDDYNDVVMADVPMAGITNFDDISGVVTIPSSETVQVPALPNSDTDAPLPSWMMGALHPGFLQELRACNLKEITLEKDKIRFSFA